MEFASTLYVKTNDIAVLEKVRFYLYSETCPDFEDEVPEEEHEIFKKLEFSVRAESIEIFSDSELIAYFEPDSMDEMESIAEAVEMLQPEKIFLYICNDEDMRHYYHYNKSVFNLIYSEIPISREEELINKQIDMNLEGSISEITDKGKVLSLLAKVKK